MTAASRRRYLEVAFGLATGFAWLGTVRAASTDHGEATAAAPASALAAPPAAAAQPAGWTPTPMPLSTSTSTSTGNGAALVVPGGRHIDAREVIVPVPGAERMRIDNPLGNVTVRAWPRTDAIHIVAEKSSPSPDALARLRVHFTAWAGGEVSLETRVEMGGRERALPLVASRIDLLVEVPASLEIEAKTFAGDLSASGLRAGARLETTGGRIGVSDVHGRLVTRQLRGGQTVLAVDGDVDLDGVEGQMRLEDVAGARIEARVVDGDIRAEDIRSNVVRLSATTGQVVLFGFLRPRAHYDLRSYGGEVRLALVAAPPGMRTPAFELRVRSPAAILSEIPLKTVWRQGDRVRAIAIPSGVRSSASEVADRPLVELSSVLGRVVLTVAQPADGGGTAYGLPGASAGAATRPF